MSDQTTENDALMVTVRAADLRAVLAAADYMTDRSLIGPVDRMSDAVALATMRADLDAERVIPLETTICQRRYIVEALADPVQDERMKCARTEGHGGRHINKACDLSWDEGAEISVAALLTSPPGTTSA